MRKHVLAAALAMAAMASCTTREIVPEAPQPEGELLTVSASFEESATRTSLDMNGAQTHADVVWNSGDAIMVFAGVGSSAYYNVFTTSDSGSGVAEFSCHSWKPVSSARYGAVYPADKAKGFNYSSSAGYTFGLVVPPVQTAVKGGVERGLLRSFATIGTSMAPNITFRNAVSLLRFRLSGSAASQVRKVKLVAGGTIAGDCMVNISDGGEFSYNTSVWYLPLEYGQSNTVDLQGSFESSADYYIATIPCVSEGFSLLFINSAGKIIGRYSDKTIPLNRSRITDIGTVTLNGSFVDTDPSVIKYIQSSKGSKPVCMAIVAEGFTASEQDKFVSLASGAVNKLFETEPFKTYKDYFNVYIMKAVSNESGASVTNGNGVITTRRDTRFGARWGSSSYDDMESDYDKVWGYVSARCPEIINGQVSIDDVAVALIINDTRYGGRCSVSSAGRCVAHVPYNYGGGSMTWDFPEIVANDDETQSGAHYTTSAERAELGLCVGDWRNTFLHEFAGHGFARLMDEYWHGTSYSTGTTISQHNWDVPYGLNISGTYSGVPWQADLLDNLGALVASDPNYSRLGRFQGGGLMVMNRWRCEKISCMIDNRQYFSAWQRELIVKRIMALSGSTFSLSSFLANDVTKDPVRDMAQSTSVRAASAQAPVKCPPLAPPKYL